MEEHSIDADLHHASNVSTPDRSNSSADTLPNANSLQSRLDLLLSVITEADDLPAQQARDDARPSSSASSMVPHKTPLQAFLHCKEDFPLYYTQRKKTAVSSPPHVQSLHTKDHALVDGADTTPGTSPGASQSARQRMLLVEMGIGASDHGEARIPKHDAGLKAYNVHST
ncbi:hypothetical protein LTS14_005543 [Recurvomyces mirabilis]|uniref:uncharacterized protein n=1 Tax=Recurvomyces mirabilis TaxID=574656 RepID=UPI002DDDE4AD|nr:hypothetical protein LTS14_005543 [Recurvomyces mirabilis]